MLKKKSSLKVSMLTLSTTNKCNFQCIYCSTQAEQSLPGELTLSEKKRVIDQAIEMGADFVFLCGSGEPLLDPHFDELYAYLRKRKCRVGIATNGSLLNKENTKVFAADKTHLIVKLHSLSACTADKLSGVKDAYEWVDYKGISVPCGIKYLFDAGYNLGGGGGFQIQSVIARDNLLDLPEIAKFCRKTQTKLYLDALIWIGRAQKNRHQLEVTLKEYYDLYAKLSAILGPQFMLHQFSTHCIGEKNPAVGVTGDISVCHLRPTTLGNIRESSLQQLFERVSRLRQQQATSCLRGIFKKNPFKTCQAREFFRSQKSTE